jgi:hypothetical protein
MPQYPEYSQRPDLVRTAFANLIVNVATTALSFTNLLSVQINTMEGDDLLIVAAATPTIAATGENPGFQLALDNAPLCTITVDFSSITVNNTHLFYYAANVGRGAHTIALQWCILSGGNTNGIQINAGSGAGQGAQLFVANLSV